MDSYIVYVGTLIGAMLLATLYNIQKNRVIYILGIKANIKNVLLLLLIILLSIVAGGRSFSVGIDTQSYVTWQFDYINRYGFNAGTMPFVARLIVYTILHITNDYHFVYLVFALLTNGFIVWRMRDFKSVSSFPLLVFGYVCFYYLATLNMWRQLLAAAIVFYATRFAFDKKYFKYLVFVLISILIHSSAIMGLIIIPVDIFIHAPKDTRKKLAKNVLLLAPLILGALSIVVYRYFDWQRYVYHFNHYGTTSNVGMMFFVRLILLLFLGLVCLDRKNIELKKSFYISLIAIILMSLDYFIVYAGRLYFYFVLFEPVVYGAKKLYLKNRKAAKLAQTLYVLLGFYTFINGIANNGNGIVPYSFWGN